MNVVEKSKFIAGE